MRGLVCISLFLACVLLSSGTDQLSVHNIDQFQDCTKVEGNLVINQNSPLTLDQLSMLTDITEITGYLLVQNLNSTNVTDLSFLQSLETIGGQETFEPRTGQEFALVVEDNEYLQTLGLSSLQSIENGGVRISGNSDLCLVDTLMFEDFLVTSTLIRIGGLGVDCSAFMCHDQCSPAKGCWGTGDSECVECRNYDYMGMCVPSCDLSVSTADVSTMECLPLTPPTTLPVTTSTSASTQPSPTNNIQTVTQDTAPQSTRKPNATEPTPTTSIHTNWPIFIGPAIVIVPVLLSVLFISIYCCWKLKKRSKKVPLLKIDKESKVSSCDHKFNSKHDKTVDTRIRLNSTDTSGTTGNQPHTPNSFFSEYQENEYTEPSYYAEGSPSSRTKLLEDSPSLGKNSARRESETFSDSSNSPKSNYRHSLTPPTMPGGVYSTRTPPSHHHRFTHHTSTSHTQQGRNSRSSSMPSRLSNNCSSGTNTCNSRIDMRASAHNSHNSLAQCI